MYDVKSLVVHPGHGTCVVEEIKKDLSKETAFYVLRPIADDGLRLYVACHMADKVGIRRMVSKERACEIWNEIMNSPTDLDKDYKKRDKEVHLALQSGDLYDQTSVCKGLMKLDKHGKISQSQKTLLNVLLKRVFSEMSVAMEVNYEDIMQDMRDVIIV